MDKMHEPVKVTSDSLNKAIADAIKELEHRRYRTDEDFPPMPGGIMLESVVVTNLDSPYDGPTKEFTFKVLP